MNQFIIIGKSDEGTQTELCLLTRRVFTSLKDAQAFVAKDRSDSREPIIVEAYFPIPTSLYRQDWRPA